MKGILITIFLILAAGSVFAQETEKRSTFIGGMFYGTSFISASNNNCTSTGNATCLGGRLSFFLTPNFYLGGRGNSITYKYGHPSVYRMGSGGVTGGYIKQGKKIVFTAGIYCGRGRITNTQNVGMQGSFYINDITSDSYFFAAPEISVAYRISGKIGLVLLADYGFFSNGTPGIKSRFDICGGVVFFR